MTTETIGLATAAAHDAWDGPVIATMEREEILFGPRRVPIECITVTTDDGQQLRAPVEDMRRLGETLIRLAGA